MFNPVTRRRERRSKKTPAGSRVNSKMFNPVNPPSKLTPAGSRVNSKTSNGNIKLRMVM